MNPYNHAHDLVRALRQSDQFERVSAARKHVENDASALRMLQDFRKRQWELETKQMTGEPVSEDDIEALQKLAEVVSLNGAVHTYLEAEYQFSVIVSDVQRMLAEVVDEAMLPAPFGQPDHEE